MFEQFLHVCVFVCAWLQPNVQDAQGQTPLFRSSQLGAVEVCRLLTNSGADPSIKAKDGSSPLALAAPAVVDILKDKQLLSKPEVVDIQTQFLEAAKNGDLETLKVKCVCNVEVFVGKTVGNFPFRIVVLVLILHVYSSGIYPKFATGAIHEYRGWAKIKVFPPYCTMHNARFPS